MKAQHLLILLFILVGACDRGERKAPESKAQSNNSKVEFPVGDIAPLSRRAFFGETHVHTELSVDAGIYNVSASVDDAYRYAKGLPIVHTSGGMIQAARPLDFMAITDHAEYLGVIKSMKDPDAELSNRPLARDLIGTDPAKVEAAFKKIGLSFMTGDPIEELRIPAIEKDSWLQTIDAAERHNVPNEFTTLIAFEWSSHREANNLHRNIIFRGGPEAVTTTPFSVFDSSHPEDLWKYLDNLRDNGMEVLAIPHNSNLSNGFMFPNKLNSKGLPIDEEYVSARSRNEPLVEITQIKGTSETHPSLSPNDEWANFELLEEIISHTVEVGQGQKGKVSGSYVREALKDGLVIEEQLGQNPYKFGILAATDSHNASSPNEEANYTGKFGIADDTPEHRRTGYTAGMNVRKWSASGLAGVWAEKNTRGSIYDAMARKETFGTSGPRIQVRFFGGWEFAEDTIHNKNWVELGYGNGVPMGGDLTSNVGEVSPRFLVWAQKDPDEAPLQRLQVIKGWLDNGIAKEQVYDVACADNGEPDTTSHRCPKTRAIVDIKTCEISIDYGDVELKTVWQDPDFNKDQNAFYYVRAIQNPTCRWSTWDAIRTNMPLLEDVPSVIEERAWSSPIWFSSN